MNEPIYNNTCRYCNGKDGIIKDGTHKGSWLFHMGKACQEELIKQGWKRPELINDRGGCICAKCGGKTRSCLDGESWCNKCQRYQ